MAVVTGVSRRIGIGFAIAHRLLADGASVLAQSWAAHDAEMPWGADPLGPDGVVGELGGGARLTLLESDLAEVEGPAALVAAAVERFGAVDVLVANHARSSHQALEALTADELDLSWAVNVRATLLLVQAFAAAHDDRRPGRVVLFTSGQFLGAMPGELPYTATKGALHQVTFSLAQPLMARGITVNCVNPGPTDTGYASGDAHAEVERRMPRRRWGTPDDAARLVAWLVSDEADWVTGQVISSDGGFR